MSETSAPLSAEQLRDLKIYRYSWDPQDASRILAHIDWQAARIAELENEVHEWEESDAARSVLGPIFTEEIEKQQRRITELEDERKIVDERIHEQRKRITELEALFDAECKRTTEVGKLSYKRFERIAELEAELAMQRNAVAAGIVAFDLSESDLADEREKR